MQDNHYLYFNGLQSPLLLIDCYHLVTDFPAIFTFEDYHCGEPASAPCITILLESGSYHVSTSWKDEIKSYTDKVDVLCELVAQVAVARSFTNLEALYLHAAGVVINNRLVVFPSVFRAGKSFLTACLMANGHRYLGDDIVPLSLDTGKAFATGFSPRLRLPLPETTDNKSRQFINSHIALSGKRYAYMGIDQELTIAPDEAIDIGAFVLLERIEGIKAQLEHISAATVFKQLIKQNFAREINSAKILSTLTQSVSNAQRIKIYYDRADEAIELLTQHFKTWPAATELLIEHGTSDSKTAEIVTGNNFIQGENIQKIRIEEESFLASADGNIIYHLNTIASGIWELLSEPVSQDEIIEILKTAFPQTEESTIEKDVTEILARLKRKKLITYS